MTTTPNDCWYNEAEGICLRPDCPKTCARNYRDQAGSDLSYSIPVEPAATKRAPRAWHTRPGLLRWLSRLAG